MNGPLRLSVIVPTLDEAAGIGATLRAALPEADEIVVVDGGSSDATPTIAAGLGIPVIQAARGRAAQMNAGASEASGDVLLFLHADTGLPAGWSDAVRGALSAGALWGRFDVRLDDRAPLLMLVGAAMNMRSRWTGVCTGDQAIFVSRQAWQRAGGYAALPLMEDVELSRRLLRLAGRPTCLRERVLVSARRWRRRGPLRTIVEMWCWRALFFAGVSPAWLHRRYYGRDT